MEAINWQLWATVPGALDGYWLIACEESATIRTEFEQFGIKVISCDLKPSRKPGAHYQGDVRGILNAHKWAGVIAHPDCTYLTLSGVRWLFDRAPSTPKVLKGPERWKAMFEAAEFFNLFSDLDCPVGIENPTMHGYASRLIRLPRTQIVQPYQFGHLETKKTGLHLKGLAPLRATQNVKAEMLKLPKKETHKVHYASSSLKDRAEVRSEFFPGIGRAMAVQWGLAR